MNLLSGLQAIVSRFFCRFPGKGHLRPGPRLFAALLLACVIAGAFFAGAVPASATSDTGGPVWTLDLARKTIKNPDPVAVSENARITVKPIGDSNPGDLTIVFTDRRDKEPLATGSGFIRSASYDNAAYGGVPLNSVQMQARFEDVPSYGEIETVVTVWDTNKNRMLAQDFVRVLNNPFITNWVVTNIVIPTNYTDIAGFISALSSDYTAVTGNIEQLRRDLSREVERANTQEDALTNRVDALEGAAGNYGLLEANNEWTGETNYFLTVDAGTGIFTHVESGSLEVGNIGITSAEPGVDINVWTNRWLFPEIERAEGQEEQAQTNLFASQEWASERMDALDYKIDNVQGSLTGVVYGVVLNGVTNYPPDDDETRTNTLVYLDGVLTEDSLSNYVKVVVLNGETNYPHDVWTDDEEPVLLETGVIDLGDLLPASSESNYVWGVFIGTNDIPTLPYRDSDPDAEYKGWYVDLSPLATTDSLLAVEANLQEQIDSAVESISGFVTNVGVALIEGGSTNTYNFGPDGTGNVVITNVMPASREPFLVQGVNFGSQSCPPESENGYWVTIEDPVPAYSNFAKTNFVLTSVYTNDTNNIVTHFEGIADRLLDEFNYMNDTLYTTLGAITNGTNLNTLSNFFMTQKYLEGQVETNRTQISGLITSVRGLKAWESDNDGNVWMKGNTGPTNTSSQSFAVGFDVYAENDGSIAGGYMARATGEGAIALGEQLEAGALDAVAMGIGSEATNDFSFVWNGVDTRNIARIVQTKYSSQSNGTFNINPVGGTDGFFIGDKSLMDILVDERPDLSGYATLEAATNIAEAATEGLATVEDVYDAVHAHAETNAAYWLKRNHTSPYSLIGVVATNRWYFDKLFANEINLGLEDPITNWGQLTNGFAKEAWADNRFLRSSNRFGWAVSAYNADAEAADDDSLRATISCLDGPGLPGFSIVAPGNVSVTASDLLVNNQSMTGKLDAGLPWKVDTYGSGAVTISREASISQFTNAPYNNATLMASNYTDVVFAGYDTNDVYPPHNVTNTFRIHTFDKVLIDAPVTAGGLIEVTKPAAGVGWPTNIINTKYGHCGIQRDVLTNGNTILGGASLEFPARGGQLALVDDLSGYATTNDLDGYLKKSGGTVSWLSVNGSLSAGTNSWNGGANSVAIGWKASTTNPAAFVFNGNTNTTFSSRGVGTFAVNPMDGLSGFYIGATNLSTYLSGYATTGALSAVSASQTNYLPLAGGAVTGGLSVGPGSSAAASNSFAAGDGAKASAIKTIALGNSGTEASAATSFAFGDNCKASQSFATAMGSNARADKPYSYVWSWNSEYHAQDIGAFCINPSNGLSGVYVGGTNMADHIAGAVADHEARMHHDTYFCRWDPTDISSLATNWIPTNNWPSTDIYLNINLSGTNALPNLNIGIRGGWAPPEDRHLVITLLRGALDSGAESGGLSIGGRIIANFVASSARRIYDLHWRADWQVWVFDIYTATSASDLYDNRGYTAKTALPNDVFLPVFDEEEPAASPAALQTPSLSPSFSPSVVSPDVNSDLDRLSIEPEDFEPLDEWPEEEPEEFEPDSLEEE